MKSPQQIVDTTDGRKIYQSVFSVYGKQMLVRVVVAELKNHNEVITAYRTSKIRKYWAGEIEESDEN